MKKRFLSLILILFLLPGAVIFSACSKGGGYNLSNLKEDFYSIASDKDDDSIVKIGNSIKFQYSSELNNAIESNGAYANLKEYNNIYENIMCFSFNYVEVCSNNEIKIDKDVKNSLEDKLNELHSSIKSVEVYTDSLETLLATENASTENCLNRYKTVLVSYEDLFEKASIFNAELNNIYFNYLISNSNPDITEVNAAVFDVSVIVSKLNARKCWQISNVASAYAEMFICGSEVANNIIKGVNLNLNPTEFKYKDMVTAINKSVNEAKAIEYAEGNKLEFYQAAQKAYVAQTILNNDNSKYVNACNKIDYAKAKLDIDNQNNIDLKIIKDYSVVLVQYNAVMVEMLEIIEG